MTPPGEDACIDLEPTGSPLRRSTDDVIIALQHARTRESGDGRVSQRHLARRSRLGESASLRNTLTGGRVGGVHTERLTLLGNTIDAGSAELTGAMIRLHGRCTDLPLEGNQVLAAGQEADGISVSGDAEQAIVVDNDVRTAGLGIDVTASGDIVEVSRNRVHGENRRPGIRVARRSANDAPWHPRPGQRRARLRPRRHHRRPPFGHGHAGKSRHHRQRDRPRGPVPPGLIGIDLTGHDAQWHDPVVEDNEIGAAIPIKIQGPA